MEETKISILNKFTTIEFETKDASKNKLQAVKDYLEKVKNNAKEYNSALFMTGAFTFEDGGPIEKWLLNSVENLKGFTIELATDWVDISHLSNAETWPLLFSLWKKVVITFLSFYRENRKGKIKYKPVAAFQFWEQQDIKKNTK